MKTVNGWLWKVGLFWCLAMLVSGWFGWLCSNSQGVMLALTIEDLVAESKVIIIGKVWGVQSFLSTNGKSIFTRAEVLVSETVAAGVVSNNVVVVEYPGGEINGLGCKVSDVAVLAEGEEVLLFLKPASRIDNKTSEYLATNKMQKLAVVPVIYQIVGHGQGKYSIRNGIARKDGFSIVGSENGIVRELPLNKLVEKIRTIAGKH